MSEARGVALSRRVVIGAEIEAYSIRASDFKILRRTTQPRPGVSELGEEFSSDSSIGSEYNSRAFTSVREASFLLKAGLRKYLHRFYRGRRARRHPLVPFLVGGWTNRFAAAHLHVSIEGRRLTRREAQALAWHLHDHLPFLIAAGANSPVWMQRIAPGESMRFVRGSGYFLPIRRGELSAHKWNEMSYSRARRGQKPSTLEIRVLDSNVPEFVVAWLCLVKAIVLRWLRRRAATNLLRHPDYLMTRGDAGLRGIHARLRWNRYWVTVPQYLDRFLWAHREELRMMDVPEEVWEVLRLLKKGWNGARILREAAVAAREEHPQTWQRRFAKRYTRGLEDLLSGNALRDFARALHVTLPRTDRVWLGRKGASIDG